jgi:hypothetical protein
MLSELQEQLINIIIPQQTPSLLGDLSKVIMVFSSCTAALSQDVFVIFKITPVSGTSIYV